MIFKLIHIIPGYLHSALFQRHVRYIPRSMPGRIDKFTFIRDLQPEKHYPFKVGLYRHISGKKAVIKIWEGQAKDIHYFDLIHQIQTLTILNRLRNGLGDKLPRHLSAVHTPGVMWTRELPRSLILAVEYINAKPLRDIRNSRLQDKYFGLVVEYLQYLGRHGSPADLRRMRRRTISGYISIFPLIFIAALVENPKIAIDVLKGGLAFIKSIPSFLGYRDMTIVHGDLNFRNILVGKQDLYILDVEQTLFTYPELELVTTLSTMGITDHLRARLLAHIRALGQADARFLRRVSSLTVNCEVHNLTWNAPAENIVWYRQMLNLGITRYQ